MSEWRSKYAQDVQEGILAAIERIAYALAFQDEMNEAPRCRICKRMFGNCEYRPDGKQVYNCPHFEEMMEL